MKLLSRTILGNTNAEQCIRTIDLVGKIWQNFKLEKSGLTCTECCPYSFFYFYPLPELPFIVIQGKTEKSFKDLQWQGNMPSWCAGDLLKV